MHGLFLPGLCTTLLPLKLTVHRVAPLLLCCVCTVRAELLGCAS